MKAPKDDGCKVVAENRRARHDYEIIDRIEAGMSLLGSEVKSLRNGGAQLVDSYAEVRNGEVFLIGANIVQYSAASYQNHDPRRPRKLLLHAAEIHRLNMKVREKGLTLVPLSLYFRDRHAKVELALARGRKSYDKRDKILQRDLDRAAHE
jgi:SsrA-binding protein